MAIKEYRVVCSRPKFGGKVIVDIAPAQGVIHDQIFFSRQWLHKKQTGEDLVKYNYSFRITVADGQEPEILYPEPLNIAAESEAYRVMLRDYRELEPEILKTYKNMSANGLQSTLYVYSGAERSALEETMKTPEEEAFDRRQRERRARFLTTNETTSHAYREKHSQNAENGYPQNLRQEENMQIVAEFKQAQQRRIAAELHRAKFATSAWQRFQKDYSGD